MHAAFEQNVAVFEGNFGLSAFLFGISLGFGAAFSEAAPVLGSAVAFACHLATDSQYLIFSRSNFSSHLTGVTDHLVR